MDQACQALTCLASHSCHNQEAAAQSGAVTALMQLLLAPCQATPQQQQSGIHLLLALLVLAVQVR